MNIANFSNIGFTQHSCRISLFKRIHLSIVPHKYFVCIVISNSHSRNIDNTYCLSINRFIVREHHCNTTIINATIFYNANIFYSHITGISRFYFHIQISLLNLK